MVDDELYDEYDSPVDNTDGADDALDDELTRMIGGKQRDDDDDAPVRKPKAKMKAKYKAGDKVTYRRQVAIVLFGPYERASKIMYELQMPDGTVMAANMQAMTDA